MIRNMHPASVTITAPSMEAARDQGAQRLGVSPEDVTVTSSGESTYTVSVKRAPGRFSLAIQEDKLAAMIEVITPPSGGGRPVTAADIENELAQRNITFGIDHAAIEQVAAEVEATGKKQVNVRIAEGQPPVRGSDGAVQFFVGEGASNRDPLACRAVKSGQVIAKHTSATEGTAGRDIFGEEIASEAGKDKEIYAGEHVTVSDDGAAFIAERYGTVETLGNRISVNPCVRISDDGVSARMLVCPKLADNSPLELVDVFGELRQAGVVFGILEKELAAALGPGQRAQEIEVAHGIPAQDGVDARITFSFRLDGLDPTLTDARRKTEVHDEKDIVKEFVTEGDVLAVKTPMRPAVEGHRVTGETVSGRAAKDAVITAGTGVTLMNDGLTYVVAEGVMGYANFTAGTLSVEEPVHISKDALAAYLCAQPPSLSGRMITVTDLTRWFETHAVTADVNLAAVEEALNQAKTSGQPVCDILVAEGQPPQPGQDAQIVFQFQTGPLPGTYIAGTDRIDYRERGMFQNVAANSLLAEKTPATPGVDGRDIFGKPLPATPGRDMTLTAVENVTVSEDGLKYFSAAPGVVMLVGGDQISVCQYYEVPGDVDYATGNLAMDGTLNIKGWIRAGFTVRARGDLCVGAGIEAAVVEAGGNIDVGGGIVGSETSKVSARGAIRARFIENAVVDAGGEVVVHDSILHSTVSAGGTVVVTEGKGRIIGGTITSRKSIEAVELGSEAVTRTVVSAGMDTELLGQIALLEKELVFYRNNKKKIAWSLTLLAQKAKQHAVNAQGMSQLSKLVKFRREAVLKENKLAQYKKALARAAENEEEPLAVRVARTVYEGVCVTILGYRFFVKEDIPHGGRFVLDTQEWAVKYVE